MEKNKIEGSVKYDLAMIVDDDSLSSFINQHVFQLNKEQFKDSIILPSGFSAIDYLKKSIIDFEVKWPDIIFLDISMPAVDGFEFIKIYEDEFPLSLRQKTDIYFITGSKFDATIHSYIKKGVVKGYLEKPLNGKSLKKLLFDSF